jgi:flagellar export protein FliJ
MPPLFIFQNILDIRHSKVESIEIQLGKIEEMLISLFSKKDSLQEMKAKELDAMKLMMQGEVDIFQLDLLRSSVKNIDEYSKKVEVEISETQKKITQVRASLVQAKQDEETLEILKEKEIEKYKSELKRIENNQQDDIYISLAFKNNRQGV